MVGMVIELVLRCTTLTKPFYSTNIMNLGLRSNGKTDLVYASWTIRGTGIERFFEPTFSLTSDVTLHAQLMVTKTKLLGSPYTKCLPETQANKCYQEKTEENIRNRFTSIK